MYLYTCITSNKNQSKKARSAIREAQLFSITHKSHKKLWNCHFTNLRIAYSFLYSSLHFKIFLIFTSNDLEQTFKAWKLCWPLFSGHSVYQILVKSKVKNFSHPQVRVTIFKLWDVWYKKTMMIRLQGGKKTSLGCSDSVGSAPGRRNTACKYTGWLKIKYPRRKFDNWATTHFYFRNVQKCLGNIFLRIHVKVINDLLPFCWLQQDRKCEN